MSLTNIPDPPAALADAEYQRLSDPGVSADERNRSTVITHARNCHRELLALRAATPRVSPPEPTPAELQELGNHRTPLTRKAEIGAKVEASRGVIAHSDAFEKKRAEYLSALSTLDVLNAAIKAREDKARAAEEERRQIQAAKEAAAAKTAKAEERFRLSMTQEPPAPGVISMSSTTGSLGSTWKP